MLEIRVCLVGSSCLCFLRGGVGNEKRVRKGSRAIGGRVGGRCG